MFQYWIIHIIISKVLSKCGVIMQSIDVRINGGKVAYFSSYTKVREVMKHPRGVYGTPFKKFKHPSEALFVIVLRIPMKELSKLPVFNSAICITGFFPPKI